MKGGEAEAAIYSHKFHGNRAGQGCGPSSVESGESVGRAAIKVAKQRQAETRQAGRQTGKQAGRENWIEIMSNQQRESEKERERQRCWLL